jgi:hypothetical protein
MKMKTIIPKLLLVGFMAISSLSFAQENMEDVVYLKNGGIIHGLIIEQIPNQSLKIKTTDRNVYVFKIEDIEKMTKETVPDMHVESAKEEKGFKKRGFFSLIENSFCTGDKGKVEGLSSWDNEDNSIGFRTVIGYQINEHLALGIGLGLDRYILASLIPITFDARISLLPGKISPVLNFNIGYAAGINGSEGGTLIHPSLGLKIFVSKKIAYFFNLGYKWQKQEVLTGYDYYQYPYNFKHTANLTFITFSTGIVF